MKIFQFVIIHLAHFKRALSRFFSGVQADFIRIWLSLSCVPWFPGYTWRIIIYLQKHKQSLETRVHMTNLTRSKQIPTIEKRVSSILFIDNILTYFLQNDSMRKKRKEYSTIDIANFLVEQVGIISPFDCCTTYTHIAEYNCLYGITIQVLGTSYSTFLLYIFM